MESSQCETCWYYDYDEEYDEYYCMMDLDEDEFLTAEFLPIERVREMLSKGEIKDGKTLVALLYYFNK